ncbi:sensor histidine kinase [Vibrio breoganii]|uniref:histidine kinase n=1 Tax=Vibrio breoganii TaxID=553239 RepID=A0ABX1U6X8_9VIBR|nr:sensor histidine kinase [Vibrio breoganii]NMO72493.1 sensor histidine kinase [Vibrio breoganii]NMR69273.1 sensor histidine kinase [Vibrio breoganii]OED85015.1 histidine kinase [Vibrio breoganii ZF-55]PML90813.1 histidine kinase [Vibrio breoganii]
MELILSLLQQMCVYLMVAYTLSKTPLVIPLLNISERRSHKLICYVMFSLFCILGTYFGLQIDDAIANTRAIGAVLGGIFGGPLVGFAVGFTGGMHRYSMGGFTDLACAISTTAEGLIGGLVHLYMVKRGKTDRLFSAVIVFNVTLVAEIIQMLIIVIVAKPMEQAISLVEAIAIPMILANSLGAAFFISILQDRRAILEKYSSAYSKRALNIAERTVGVLSDGLNTQSAQKIASIIQDETHVGAVAITDKDKILAFEGTGSDHHRPNTPISSEYTHTSIREQRIIYLDGRKSPYQCSLSSDCKLGSALVIPLIADDKVIGTIKLYEPRVKLFSSINMTMAKGIAELLSSQILNSEYQQKKMLLSQAEIKLLHAQVNPHFLFNALNTISAITRRDPHKARELIQHLSQFFRGNLKRNTEFVTLREELTHVNSYLTIEKSRFVDRLEVEIDIAEHLLDKMVPSFTLQPLVENAIKHGVSNLLENGIVKIYSSPDATGDRITVEDNAGSYEPENKDQTGLGMQIVAKRLTNYFGEQYQLKIECDPNNYTRMSFIIPSNHKDKHA